MIRTIGCFIILTQVLPLKSASQLHLKPNVDRGTTLQKFSVLPQNFYNHHKGFVCKKEDQLQKKTGLPLFIRLGSKSYVDYLEQKPNAVWTKP